MSFPQLLRHGALREATFEVPGTVSDSDCEANASDANLLELESLDARSWDILGAIERGTFCSDESAYLDQPVAQTRFVVANPAVEQPLDAEPGAPTPQNLERDVQPMRINNLQVGDLNMAAQVTADANISLLDQSDVSLGELCFPLPPLPLGFAVLQSSLELNHTLDVTAHMSICKGHAGKRIARLAAR